MMIDDAPVRHVAVEALLPEPVAEIHVLVAVEIFLAESPQAKKDLPRNEPARPSDRRRTPVFLPRWRNRIQAEMPGHTLDGEENSGVIDQAGLRFALHISDNPRFFRAGVHSQHRLEPAG